ncbi:hypothetical protein TcasGA2_TC014614 [Tribolium castaneum]|uniref:Uncharacterized protein n=1 Tax=Tribolium castaneum TaxID=7070 RepID=D6WMY4_TRICA|nr:hypothetical protein TcasGA2_TC014614 [Tribolium castaneum]
MNFYYNNGLRLNRHKVCRVHIFRAAPEETPAPLDKHGPLSRWATSCKYISSVSGFPLRFLLCQPWIAFPIIDRQGLNDTRYLWEIAGHAQENRRKWELIATSPGVAIKFAKARYNSVLLFFK